MSANEPISSLWTKNYVLILITNFFVYISFYLLVPTLPAFAKQLGGGSLQASLVVSGFSISSLICRAITGHLTDIIDKKPIFLIGLLILALCTLSFIFLPIWGIIVVRILQGVGWGMASTAIAAVISDIVPDNQRGEGMGYYSLSMIVSMALAPVIAIMVMNNYHFNIVAVISILLAGIGLFIFNLTPFRSNKSLRRNNEKLIVLKDLFEKRALLPSFLCFLLTITLCGIMSYIMIYGKEINLSNIWIYFIGHASMVLVTRSFVGRLFDKKGHVVVILPGAISMILGLIVLSFVNSVTTLIIASLLYGFGYGAVQPSLQAWAVNRSPSERRGAANGTFLSSMDLSFTIGSVLLSFIAESISYSMMYRLSAIFMAIFILVYVSALAKEKKDSVHDTHLDLLKEKVLN